MKKALLLVILYFVCQFVGTLPFMAWKVFHGVSEAWKLSSPAELGAAVLIGNALLLAHLLFWKDVRFGRKSCTEVTFGTLVLCVPLVLSAMFVLNVVCEYLPNWTEAQFADMAGSPWGILAIVVGAPLAEEFLFRGGVMNSLHRAGYSPKAMIVWSAALFGIAHLNPAQIPFAFMLGLLLGWLYYRTGSLVPGILCHFINNFLGVLSMQSARPSEHIIDMVGGIVPLIIYIVMSVVVFAVSFWYARRHLQTVNDTFQPLPDKTPQL